MKIMIESEWGGLLISTAFRDLATLIVSRNTPDATIQTAMHSVRRGEPVLVVLNSHSNDPNVWDETRRSAARYMREIVGSGYEILVAQPEIVASVFFCPSAVRQMEAASGVRADLATGQTFDPMGELSRVLAGRDFQQALEGLDEAALAELRRNPFLAQVEAHATSIQSRVAA